MISIIYLSLKKKPALHQILYSKYCFPLSRVLPAHPSFLTFICRHSYKIILGIILAQILFRWLRIMSQITGKRGDKGERGTNMIHRVRPRSGGSAVS